jgi:hypothetical protein
VAILKKNLKFIMKYSFVLFFYFFLTSCINKKNDLELIILNEEIISCDYNEKYNEDTNASNSINIIKYKLVNNSNTTYYFNKNYREVYKMSNYLVGLLDDQNTVFIDENSNTAKPTFSCKYPTDSMNIYTSFHDKFEEQKAKSLGYKSGKLPLNNNFTIHPGETLYFEYFINLSNDKFGNNESRITFNKEKRYMMKVQIYSDSKNNKNTISFSDLKTIETNNYKIFNGIISSKNEVPLKFVKCE